MTPIVLRTIAVTVTDSDTVALVCSGTTDGYHGENLSTRLSVTVPASWDTYSAHVTWEAADGWQDESPAFLIGDPAALSFDYDLPFNAMKYGALRCSITAKLLSDGDVQIVHTANFTLNISRSVDGTASQIGPFADAIEDHEARISGLEGGSATTNGIAATGVLTDNRIVRGDGGVRNVQTSGIAVDDSGNLAGSGSISMGTNIVSVGLTQGATGKFGAVDGGNYSEFEADGTYKMNGTATVYKDQFQGALGLRVGGTAPTFAAFKSNIYGYSFSASAQNEMHGSFELQHDYKEGTDIEVHVHWSPIGTDNKNIVWGFQYTVANMETEVFPAVTVITAIDAAAGVDATHQLLSIGTISGVGRKIGDVIPFMVYRNAADAADTFTGAAFLHQVGLHYQADTIGSRTISVK